jgi:hypothetical protein
MKLKQTRKQIRKKTKRFNYKIKQSMKRNKVKKTRQNYNFKRNRSRTMKRGGAAGLGATNALNLAAIKAGEGEGAAAPNVLPNAGNPIGEVETRSKKSDTTNLKLNCNITTDESGKKSARCEEVVV